MKRYGVLLGLIKSLTSYIQSTAGAAAAASSGTVGVTGPNPRIPPRQAPTDPDAKKSTVPTLSQYLVHPLEPMTDPSPLAQDAFFQAINTQLLPAVKEADEALVQKHPGEDESRTRARLTELRGQLEKDSAKTTHLAEYIDKVASGFNWEMRPDMEDEDDEDDDLFGGGSDDDGDVDMEKQKEEKKDEAPPDPAATNPRHGWSVTDYLRLLDTGKPPRRRPHPRVLMVSRTHHPPSSPVPSPSRSLRPSLRSQPWGNCM
ncbi:hypothetical protein A1Q1_02763 [Trichosporon asahii var. asahii CBS 2479]|uniref:Uncharacterized protein n=1 Tax=Trichosporon asahii var. asahii (strain ATCC 90039 / CBS 2479 / JCM 2466 / KCTC 7840 / NBRC 103889/ NCYC 2677 / UAMH 7654) TaxID=1186058 RepID=J6EZA4_TRIAS|nr:hypothetical protein A1Q1_02763 [Trichosporon asahii var. asahii CBS 2479]EJT48197.1 hypothetical protein A1Q1_02763 [Trichosporon asahii var. asahii CBS 2479]